MGVDTVVRFPAGVRIAEIAEASAILLGRPKTWRDLDSKADVDAPTAGGWVHVDGISYKTTDTMPQCVTISIKDVPPQWWLFYHFEGEHGAPLMIGRSRAERIAYHRALVRLFGGTVEYNDAKGGINYRRKPPTWLCKTSNDKHYHAMQLALWKLEPLSKDEIAECEQYAAYKEKD